MTSVVIQASPDEMCNKSINNPQILSWTFLSFGNKLTLVC